VPRQRAGALKADLVLEGGGMKGIGLGGQPKLPLLGEAAGLLHRRGAYAGDYVRTFVADELAALGVRTFGDLRRSDPHADPSRERFQRPCVRRRTIEVDTSALGVVEFDAPQDTRDAVVANGAVAAGRFLRRWDWERYKRDCRGTLPPAE
jgi:hypothetical protein